jgi:methylglutaconyl-CoA hydratase
MNNDFVLFERYSEEIAACVLNNPAKRNALSITMMQQLCDCAERIEKDGKIRIWILRGNGEAFCAGLDVGEVMDPNLGVESAKMVRRCLSAVYRIPVVTLAMVYGAARGGGAGLVAACDFAVADSKATIGFPEVRLGLVPAQVMSLLIRKLKRSDIKELLLSGEPVDAERALQMGLFNRVGDLETMAGQIISPLLQAAPGSLARTKRLMDHVYPRSLADDIELGMLQYMKAREAKEAQEGIRSFLEKRKPFWQKDWTPLNFPK